MKKQPTDDDEQLTAKEFNHLKDFFQRGAVNLAFNGEDLVIEASLGLPKVPDGETVEEVGRISLRFILAATILNAEREEETSGEDARDKLLALAGRFRELARLAEQQAENLLGEEWGPGFANSLVRLKTAAGV